jgi:hypothetical protein
MPNEAELLEKIKNIKNYNKPYNPVVLGIVHSNTSAKCVIQELFEMLQDNFARTEAILGEEMTNLVLNQTMLKHSE